MNILKFLGGFFIGVILVFPAAFLLRAIEIHLGEECVGPAAFLGLLIASPEVVKFCGSLFSEEEKTEHPI